MKMAPIVEVQTSKFKSKTKGLNLMKEEDLLRGDPQIPVEKKLPHTKCGVSLKLLKELRAEYMKVRHLYAQDSDGTEYESKGKRFVELIVKVTTQQSQRSYADHLNREYVKKLAEAVRKGCGQQQILQERNERLGNVDVFVSHQWRNETFPELVKHLEKWEQNEGADLKCEGPVMYWIDQLALNQHNPEKHLLEATKQVISQAKKTIVVVASEKLEPLSRTWCLFEMAFASKKQSSFEISGMDISKVTKSFVDHFGKKIAAVDVAKSETSIPGDREKLLAELASGWKGGIMEVNANIKKRLHERLDAVIVSLDRTPTPGSWQVEYMSTLETARWIRSVGRSNSWSPKIVALYAGFFEEEEISMSTLKLFEKDDLKELGIKKMGHRIILFNEIKKFTEASELAASKRTQEGGCFGHTGQTCPQKGKIKMNGAKKSVQKCWNCGQYGHKAMTCTRKEKICFACGQSGHNQFSDQCPAPKNQWARCWNCGKKNHITRNCPHPRGQREGMGLCFICWEVGHISNFCPNRCTFCKEKKKSGSVRHSKEKCPYRTQHPDYDRKAEESRLLAQKAQSAAQQQKDILKIPTFVPRNQQPKKANHGWGTVQSNMAKLWDPQGAPVLSSHEGPWGSTRGPAASQHIVTTQQPVVVHDNYRNTSHVPPPPVYQDAGWGNTSEWSANSPSLGPYRSYPEPVVWDPHQRARSYQEEEERYVDSDDEWDPTSTIADEIEQHKRQIQQLEGLRQERDQGQDDWIKQLVNSNQLAERPSNARGHRYWQERPESSHDPEPLPRKSNIDHFEVPEFTREDTSRSRYTTDSEHGLPLPDASRQDTTKTSLSFYTNDMDAAASPMEMSTPQADLQSLRKNWCSRGSTQHVEKSIADMYNDGPIRDSLTNAVVGGKSKREQVVRKAPVKSKKLKIVKNGMYRLKDGRIGKILWVGELVGKKGTHYGFALKKGEGSSDGTHRGRRLFKCESGKAEFVLADEVERPVTSKKEYTPSRKWLHQPCSSPMQCN